MDLKDRNKRGNNYSDAELISIVRAFLRAKNNPIKVNCRKVPSLCILILCFRVAHRSKRIISMICFIIIQRISHLKTILHGQN